jgi:hypothetical protein
MEIVNLPLIKVSSMDGKYDEYPLRLGVNLIGRKSNDISISDEVNYIGLLSNDTKISRKHFYIEWNQNSKGENFLLIFDNISANSTSLKGFGNEILNAEDKVYLVHNDEIIIGETSIIIHIPLTFHMMKSIIVERSEENVKTLTWGAKRPI